MVASLLLHHKLQSGLCNWAVHPDCQPGWLRRAASNLYCLHSKVVLYVRLGSRPRARDYIGALLSGLWTHHLKSDRADQHERHLRPVDCLLMIVISGVGSL